MKTILVPTDLSPMTTYALDVAVDLARTHHADVVLLHTVFNEVMPVGDSLTGMTYDMGQVYEDACRESEDLLSQMANNPKYIGVTIRKKLGSNLDGLIRCINDQPADLIVLASKGASGLMEWLEGSHAELIVRHAHCPVLVVKQPVGHFQPQNIICAIDVDDKLKEPHPYPFQLTDQGLRQFIYILTPNDPRQPEGIRSWMDEYALAKGIDHFDLAIRSARKVPEGILDYAEEKKADLIVLYTHGHKGLRHWIEGSVAEDVLNHANVPVLIMRA